MRKKRTMKYRLAIVMLLTGLLLLASCATTTSQITFHEEPLQDKDSVIIYVYRLRSMVGAIAPWAVRLDNKIVAMLKQNAYFVLHTSPGAHTITIGDSMAPILIGGVLGQFIEAVEMSAEGRKFQKAQASDSSTVSANRVYFYRSAGFAADFVSKEEAMKEIIYMKYDTGLEK
jgi:hypothetical protein